MDTKPPIAQLAADYGMSGRELAKHLSVTPSTAHRILRGDRDLTLDEALAAAKALGCTVTDLARDGVAA